MNHSCCELLVGKNGIYGYWHCTRSNVVIYSIAHYVSCDLEGLHHHLLITTDIAQRAVIIS